MSMSVSMGPTRASGTNLASLTMIDRANRSGKTKMRCMIWVMLLTGTVIGLGSSSSAQFRQRFVMPLVESQVTPEIERSVQLALDDALRLIDQKQFVPAVTRLQSVLDHSEDYFLEKEFRSKNDAPTGIRAQTLKILADLPAEGRAAYEAQVGMTARDLLKEGLTTNDLDKVSLVASHYQMTAAGFDALQVLAANAFDHDQPLEAAFLCDALLTHPRATGPLKGPLLLQAAYAWYIAGYAERSRAALERLNAEEGPFPWRIGGRGIGPIRDISDVADWLKLHFGQTVQRPSLVVNTWGLPRGGSTGNESASATCPVGGGVWTISPRKHLRLLTDADANQKRIEGFNELTHQVERTMRENNRLTQPAAVPVIVGDVVAYRTLNDVTAVSLKTGRLLWRSAATDGMLAWLFQSSYALSETIPSSSLMTFRGYLRFKLFRDQLSGSLTSDGKNIYAIEESDSQFNTLLPRSRTPFGAQMMADPANKLVAYELTGGRLLWEIGGQSGTSPADLSGFFFLGPPLPMDGRLFCLAESKNELRLLSVMPEAKSARLEWSQALVTTDRSPFLAPRRLAGLVPAIAEGIAVCPTANGSVVAFDLVQRQLRWGYSYESPSRRNPQVGSDFMSEEEEGRWLEGGPILANGCVIVTPRDSSELHCLSLADGTLKWKRPREQGLYVGCVNDDQVIVIARTQVTALSLTDGSELWKEPIEIPEPSGRGVRIDTQYLLPLSTGEIATLDLTAGRILGKSKLPEGRIPGNLAAGAGALVSCGTHAVIGFRPLAEIEEQVSGQLKTNPLNAEALALRGELRLHRGQEDDAISDLRQSLQQQPKSEVKRILAETLLNRLRTNPRGILESAAELETLTEDARQRIEFMRLYAGALSETGDRVGAVTQLIRLSLTSTIPDDMIAIGPAHFVSREQSIRSRLFKIYAEATADQKAAIVLAFAKELETSLAAADRSSRLARFTHLSVGHPAADRVLLRLAESKEGLSDELSRIRLLERLTESDNKSIAATAIAALATHLQATNARQDAQAWIDELRARFPLEICRDGKTGRQFSDEWAARVQSQPLKTGSVWPQGFIDVERTEQSTTQATFPVDVVTCVGHYFEGWTFETDSLMTTLTARDPSLKPVWRLALVNSSDDVRGQPSQLHIVGRRLALSSGMWLGVMEVPDSKSPPRILFDQSLRPNSLIVARSADPPVERRLLPNGRRFQLMSDARGTAGFLVGLSDNAVCYQLDNRLYAADPETGRILWSRVGSQFSKTDATVDRFVVLNTSTNGALVLQTIDGTLQERHPGSASDTTHWFHGTRRLSYRAIEPDQRLFEMRDFEGDRLVWQSQHPAESLPSVIEADELAVLEPSGKFSVMNLSSGEVRLSTQTPIIRPKKVPGVIAVQRLSDRYLVVAGNTVKNTDLRNVVPLNIGSPRSFGAAREIGLPSIAAFTIDGFVCAIGRTDGKVLWSVPVSDLAFDTAQPSGLPVLVLASWQSELDRFSGFALSPRLSALVIDKRTGRRIYETQEAMVPIGRGVQFNPMIEDRKLVIDFYNWQLDLTFLPVN